MQFTFLIIIIVYFLSRFSSLLREILIANFFGATRITDAYASVVAINFKWSTILSVLLYITLIPVLIKYKHREIENSDYVLFNTVTLILLFITSIMSLIIFIGADVLIKFIAPGFDFETHKLAVFLLRLTSPILILYTLSMLLRIYNTSKGRYRVAILTDLASALIILGGILCLVHLWGIRGVGISFLLGAGFSSLSQLPWILRERIHLFRKINFTHPGLREIFALILPLIFAILIFEITTFVTYRLASTLFEGCIAVLNYGFTINQFFVGLIEAGMLGIIFPKLSESLAQENKGDFKNLVTMYLKIIFLVIIPISVFIILLRKEIITLLFQRGRFDMESTTLTSLSLLAYSVGLFAWAIDMLFFRVIYLLRKIKFLLFSIIFRAVVNIILCLVLIRYLGFIGLALAFSIASIVNFLISITFLNRLFNGLLNIEIIKTISKIIASSFFIFVFILVLNNFVELSAIRKIIINVVIGSILYLALLSLLKVKETRLIKKLLEECFCKLKLF